MTRTEFVEEFAVLTGRTKSGTKELIDELLTYITQKLIDGERIEFYGFGTLERSRAPGRKMYDINTGQYFMSKDRTVVKFRPGASLIAAVSE